MRQVCCLDTSLKGLDTYACLVYTKYGQKWVGTRTRLRPRYYVGDIKSTPNWSYPNVCTINIDSVTAAIVYVRYIQYASCFYTYTVMCVHIHFVYTFGLLYFGNFENMQLFLNA